MPKGKRVSEADMALMNHILEMADDVDDVVKRIQDTPGVDADTVALAKVQLQQGINSLVKSVSRPFTF